MRLRLFLSFALIGLVSVFSVVLIARKNTTTAVRAFMVRGGMTAAGGLLDSLQNYYRIHGSWQGVDRLLKTQGPQHGQGYGMGSGMGGMMRQRLRISDAQGAVVADTLGSNPFGSFNRNEFTSAIEIRVDGRTVGYLLGEGGMNFNQGDETFLVARLTRAALTAGLISAGLALLLSILLATSLMKPVRALTQAAGRLGQGDLSQRVSIKGKDELAVLANTFNVMANSLQKAEQNRKALTADVAHELRNPLAVQRANLEALQDGIYPLSPEALEPILEQNQLLTRLVEDLRTIALVDDGELKLECTRVDLSDQVQRVVVQFNPQAAAHKVQLHIDDRTASSKPTTVMVDPQRLDQILGNLLSNALRYTPEGGEILLTIDKENGRIQVVVQDSGPGIPPEALEHIFERFYRADRSRSRSEGGAGLGLAIARKLAVAQGGSLTAANDPSGGAKFILTLPAQD